MQVVLDVPGVVGAGALAVEGEERAAAGEVVRLQVGIEAVRVRIVEGGVGEAEGESLLDGELLDRPPDLEVVMAAADGEGGVGSIVVQRAVGDGGHRGVAG